MLVSLFDVFGCETGGTVVWVVGAVLKRRGSKTIAATTITPIIRMIWLRFGAGCVFCVPCCILALLSFQNQSNWFQSISRIGKSYVRDDGFIYRPYRQVYLGSAVERGYV